MSLVVLVSAAGCSALPQQAPSVHPQQTAEDRATADFDLPKTDAPLPKAIDVSRQPKDVELAQNIDRIIDESEFRSAQWGVFVASLKDGRVLTARDAQKLFNPASTQKVMTTAVALDRLGADFRWRTSAVAETEIDANGNLNGDLILYGRGAPDFDEKRLAELVAQLKQKGLRSVSGGVIGDASFFRADALGDGWMWNEAQWYYGAEPSALSYSDNTVLVEVTPNEKIGEPASVKITPEAPFVKITNTAVTVEKESTRDNIGVHRGLETNDLQIWGEMKRGKTFSARTTMHAPQLWAANELKKSLEKNGVTVAGNAAGIDWKTAKFEIGNLKELAAVESDTLGEIARRTNKQSINLNSELMLRTLGHQARENAESQTNKKTVQGDDFLGASVIKNWLAGKGVEIGDTKIHDGSGLSRLNLVTPETMGRLLFFAAKMKSADVFKDSLPVAGTDGTLG
ncbi:MAG TPA: D-alanyl-D-alanine carboxypeptidase/D-alanyl-D-alanine-endopeptidase, partial [Pyrinomonadaceae bacterium]|nr:D-alanyl-D-alanine carboxypeptidase/D-alanyl-D-alanine-endopeptidase [Pyrinomonadaceae bacterium]